MKTHPVCPDKTVWCNHVVGHCTPRRTFQETYPHVSDCRSRCRHINTSRLPLTSSDCTLHTCMQWDLAHTQWTEKGGAGSVATTVSKSGCRLGCIIWDSQLASNWDQSWISGSTSESGVKGPGDLHIIIKHWEVTGWDRNRMGNSSLMYINISQGSWLCKH